MRSSELIRAVGTLASFVLLAACGSGSNSGGSTGDGSDLTGSGGNGEPLPEGVFESAPPDGADYRGPSAQGTGATGATPGSDPGSAENEGAPAVTTPDGAVVEERPATIDEDGNVAAARAIEEADIIKVSGDRLYALSGIGGLSVVDISDPDDLELLGRHRSTATPFEMYVRDETVFVLYNGYGEYVEADESGNWTFYQTSYVIALDTADPQQMEEQQRFEVAGYIADSRLIGDVMYVVAFDDASCYRCGDRAETNVMSLDVSSPSEIVKVDELSFEERLDEFGWTRSLSATDERLYIAGPRYGSGAEPEGSIIQVVDITDAGGAMQEGDSIEVAGQINSRWQMDEYDGVLRVISQPLWWRADGVPVVETFDIESSEELTPLGETALVLPRPETLQSVRFDGPRAYAITFEQTDPLFTIDLSEPATPLQMGELEMPGWVYYMEPRGDRVIGLGFDQGNPEGALTVSIFDVSNLAEPSMLARVNFGGDWAQLAEDQDRIHKSFQVLDDQELILVPFSGWDYSRQDECTGQAAYVSGVQLIDWVEDGLELRGIAPARGQARRAFFVGERLLTMSDERLQTFDVSDRDEPSSTSMVELAQIVSQVAAVGDSIVRIGSDWWTNGLEATVSSLEQLRAFDAGVSVSLEDINRYTCESESYLSDVLAGDDAAYFLYNHYDWSTGNYEQQLGVLTLDVSDPTVPEVAGDVKLDFVPSYGRNYVPGMVDNGSVSLALGSSLVFAQHNLEYNDVGFLIRNDYTLEVIDLSEPSEPERSSVLMPASIGSTGLLASGSVVATSHFEVSPTNPNSVRFFLDRVDLSDPTDPELLGSVNIPGSLLAYDHDAARALTVDYQYVLIEDISPQQCYEEEFGEFVTPDPSVVDYVNARGPCQALRYRLNLVEIDGDVAELVDSYEVDKGVNVTAAALGEDRVFLGTGTSGSSINQGGVALPEPGIAIGGAAPGRSVGFYYTSYSFQTASSRLLVVSGLAAGELEVAALELETTSNFYGFSNLLAKGTKAVVATGWQGKLSIIDASDASDPVVFDSVELGGGVSDLAISGNTAIAALGPAGVQTLELGED